MHYTITFNLRGKENKLYVDYQKIPSAQASGFTAFRPLFDADDCIGYSMLHAYFEDLNLNGYEKYCGFIQLIKREEFRKIGEYHAVI